VWFRTEDQLKKFPIAIDGLLYWGCETQVVGDYTKREATPSEFAQYGPFPVVVLTLSDFEKVLKAAQSLQRLNDLQPKVASSGSNDRLPPDDLGGPPPPISPTPSPTTPQSAGAIVRKIPIVDARAGGDCKWDGDICLNKEGASFSVTCNGVGFQISTKGEVSVVGTGDSGELSLRLGPSKSE
jgi:hypothetical protein